MIENDAKTMADLEPKAKPEPAWWHDYLSTSCLHGEHDYCASPRGAVGAKRPAQCKFCDAECRCDCHRASPE